MHDAAQYLKERIRTVPDWPQPGIQFRDITPLLQNAKSFRMLSDLFVERYLNAGVEMVAGIDARGFILGAVIAHELNAGFIPIRKRGKLPHATLSEAYELEYGHGAVEIHADACAPHAQVLLVDDLVATGGTMLAAARLLTRLGATVVETAAIVDLPALGGSQLLAQANLPLYAVCSF